MVFELIEKPEPDGLWKSTECADYLRVSHRQFVDRIMCLPSFPKPIRLPTKTGGKGHPRWYKQEVKKWVKEQKEAA
jgi:predicted DNA-binding transcriptional regulator AlpA